MDLEMQLLPVPPPPAVCVAVLDDESGYGYGGTSSSTRQIMKRAILVLQSMLIFTQGTSSSSSSNIDHVTYGHAETARIERTEEEADAAQTEPLLKIVDDTSRLEQPIRTLIHVLHSCQRFKAHAASACVHHSSSGATEREPQVAEASDHRLESSSEHHITIDQTTTNNMTTASQLQHSQSKNISKIVREKNLHTLNEFGGLPGIEDALGTDFGAGISDSEAIHRSSCRGESSISPVPKHKLSHLVWEEVKSMTILLLLLAVALSFVSGIYEEGLPNGCYDGAIILIAIFLLVLFASIRKYCQQLRGRKKLQKQQQGRVQEVQVTRGGEPKYICESKLVCGDVVLLKKGCQVPADGLFVGGQALELDSVSESSMIDEQQPFLSYGERVINGDARMVVTSINMDTGWSEMMSKATSDPNTKFKLETHLDKLNACIHYTRLIISILILLVVFLRYKAGKMDEENGFRSEPMAGPTPTSALANTLRKLIKESKYTRSSLTKLLSVSLVGVTEGVPFVVSLAIFYRSHITLSGKATEQDSQVVAKMASVTRIVTDMFGDFTEDETKVDMVFTGGEVVSECTTISPSVVEALCEGICILKEKAVDDWAKEKWGLDRERTVQNLTMMYEDESVKKILDECPYYFTNKGEEVPMDDEMRRSFEKANEYMQHKQLRTIAFSYRRGIETPDADDSVLVALLGLKSKSKEVTKEEVTACRECKIVTVIVSSKQVAVLKDIALRCGVMDITDSESLAMITGEDFRKFTEEERLERVKEIRVLGEATATDKSLLVETLRKKGEVVAFLGQRTVEAPTLKGADIGIAMGTWSSMKARESCDIIIWEESFHDFMSIVYSGIHIHEDIKRFLQLVLITTISSTLINFSGTVGLGDAPLTAVQLVWVNLAVDFLGGFALLTMSKTDTPVISKLPDSSRRSLITRNMIMNILAQVLYQVMSLMILRVKGPGALGSKEDMKYMVSNSFIICQLFNLFNARELEKKNFFRGIHRHTKFWVSVTTFIVLHATFVMVQDIIGYGTRMNWKLWGGCVLIGLISWPVDWLGKCISGSSR